MYIPIGNANMESRTLQHRICSKQKIYLSAEVRANKLWKVSQKFPKICWLNSIWKINNFGSTDLFLCFLICLKYSVLHTKRIVNKDTSNVSTTPLGNQHNYILFFICVCKLHWAVHEWATLCVWRQRSGRAIP